MHLGQLLLDQLKKVNKNVWRKTNLTDYIKVEGRQSDFIYLPAYSTSFLAQEKMGDSIGSNYLDCMNQQDPHMRKGQHYNQPAQYLSHLLHKEKMPA